MGLAEDLSLPKIVFTDTQGATPVVRTCAFQRPSKFMVKNIARKTTSESNAGIKETLFYYSKDLIEIGWELLGVGPGVPNLNPDTEYGFGELRRLWLSCRDGTPFTLYRNRSVTSAGYPSGAVFKTHRNIWTVRFQDGYDFTFENAQNAKDRHNVTLQLEEVISE